MTTPVCRDASVQSKQDTAQLQQQLDSAQADLRKALSQMKQQQDTKDDLEQQLQQVSGQLAVRQQEDTQVRTQSLCLLPKSPPGQAAEPSLTPITFRHLGQSSCTVWCTRLMWHASCF